MGPRELFYADIFASRRTGCRSTLGMPGVRDRHSGCVGAYLVEHDLFDFLLLSLPDNDWHSHRAGPEGQVRSIALADVQLARVMDAAGGVEEFLEEHAVIVMADHSQAPVTRGSRARTTSSPSWTCSLPVRAATARRPALRHRRGRQDAGSSSPDRGVPVPARGDGLRARRGSTATDAPRGGATGACDRRSGARDVAGARRPRTPVWRR